MTDAPLSEGLLNEVDDSSLVALPLGSKSVERTLTTNPLHAQDSGQEPAGPPPPQVATVGLNQNSVSDEFVRSILINSGNLWCNPVFYVFMYATAANDGSTCLHERLVH